MSDETIALEEGQRLSRSRLWDWQRRYFMSQGAAAWQSGTVPHYVTSNTFMADAYAQTVLGFLRDSAAQIDRGQPVYLIELGAGIGRFGFHFLVCFFERLAQSPLAGLAVTYVLSDLAPANVDFYLSHPQLRPYFDAGRLDCAVFDATRDSELALRKSGVTLSPAGLRNPLVILANYFFDGVPADAFSLVEDRLYEELVSLRVLGPIADRDDPALLQHVELDHASRPAALPYYGDAQWDRILDVYAQRGGKGRFLFPCAALDCLARLRALLDPNRGTAPSFLLLSADKGAHALSDVLGQGASLTVHGSFSLLVNYHAIAEWVRGLGGLSLHTDHRQGSLSLNAFVLPAQLGDGAAVETRRAFADAIACGGPDDLFLVKKALDYRYETLTVEQALALIRITAYDAKIFCGCIPVLREALLRNAASSPLSADILSALALVRARFFSIGEADELGADLADFFASLDQAGSAYAQPAVRGHRFATLRILPAPLIQR